jgi:hypothetical protein
MLKIILHPPPREPVSGDDPPSATIGPEQFAAYRIRDEGDRNADAHQAAMHRPGTHGDLTDLSE